VCVLVEKAQRIRMRALVAWLPYVAAVSTVGRRTVIASGSTAAAATAAAAAALSLPPVAVSSPGSPQATTAEAKAIESLLSRIPCYFVTDAMGRPYLTEVDPRGQRFGYAFIGPLDAALTLREVRDFDPTAALSVVPLASVYLNLAKTSADAEMARSEAPQPKTSWSTDMRLFELRAISDEARNLQAISMVPGATLLPGVNLYYEPDLFMGSREDASRMRPYGFRLTDLNSVWRQAGGDDRNVGRISPTLRVLSLQALIRAVADGTLDCTPLLLPASETADFEYRAGTASSTATPPAAEAAATEVAATAASPRTTRTSKLLELRGGCAASAAPDGPSSLSPNSALLAWRSHRLRTFAEGLDGSRYHAQVLFCDDDGRRARTCEAMLERVAQWADAGWWIYPHAASTPNGCITDGEAAPRSLRSSASTQRLGLCQTRLSAPAATVEARDLLDYDLVVAVDYEVLEQLRGLARQLDDDAQPQLLCVTDFLAYDVSDDGGDQRMDALDEELRELLAPHYSAVAGLTELPSVLPTQTEEWERLLAAVALSCSGLTIFLKDAIDAWFLRAYDELLRQLFPTRKSVEGTSWVDVERIVRSHIVTGGLDGAVRRQLFEEHRARLIREAPPEAERATRA
jgi:hypothetical protein